MIALRWKATKLVWRNENFVDLERISSGLTGVLVRVLWRGVTLTLTLKTHGWKLKDTHFCLKEHDLNQSLILGVPWLLALGRVSKKIVVTSLLTPWTSQRQEPKNGTWKTTPFSDTTAHWKTHGRHTINRPPTSFKILWNTVCGLEQIIPWAAPPSQDAMVTTKHPLSWRA